MININDIVAQTLITNRQVRDSFLNGFTVWLDINTTLEDINRITRNLTAQLTSIRTRNHLRPS